MGWLDRLLKTKAAIQMQLRLSATKPWVAPAPSTPEEERLRSSITVPALNRSNEVKVQAQERITVASALARKAVEEDEHALKVIVSGGWTCCRNGI
jgi:hypothetical protein